MLLIDYNGTVHALVLESRLCKRNFIHILDQKQVHINGTLSYIVTKVSLAEGGKVCIEEGGWPLSVVLNRLCSAS